MKRLGLMLAIVLMGSSAWALNSMSGVPQPIEVRLEDVPLDLSFQAKKINVLSPSWFGNLFPASTSCSDQLTIGKQALGIEVKALGPRQISIKVNGQESAPLAGAEADYVPVYYRNFKPVHPSFSLQLPNWVRVQMEIHILKGKKTLVLSLVQGRPGAQRLLPILSASE